MRRRAAAISAADPGERLPVPPTGDELERLGETLNEMLDRLEAALERERGFVADASHELRTPLALLRTELELALRHGGIAGGAARGGRVRRREETDRLVAARRGPAADRALGRGRAPAAASSTLDVARAARRRSASRFEWRAADAGATPLRVRRRRRAARSTATGSALEQALGNLVDNALRHGGGDGAPRARPRRTARSSCTSATRAAASPPDFLEHAFERFAARDGARSRGGAGLGLAIVAAIAEAHGGRAVALNRAGGGADVWLELPGNPAPARSAEQTKSNVNLGTLRSATRGARAQVFSTRTIRQSEPSPMAELLCASVHRPFIKASHPSCGSERKGGQTMRKLSAAFAVAAIAATIAVWAPWASGAGSSYEPVLDPADFTTTIDNPYFPLPVGRTWVYQGVKDGQSQVDTVIVTNHTKLVAEGITARVVTDVATHDGAKLEETSDWYAQDDQGNVWYLGEDTKQYLPNGKVDTSGSWEAGVHDAEPGMVMEANPQIPDAYRQEFLSNQAEDTAWVVERGSLGHGPVRDAQECADDARGNPARAGRVRPEDLCAGHRHRARASADWRAGVRRAGQRQRVAEHRLPTSRWSRADLRGRLGPIAREARAACVRRRRLGEPFRRRIQVFAAIPPRRIEWRVRPPAPGSLLRAWAVRAVRGSAPTSPRRRLNEKERRDLLRGRASPARPGVLAGCARARSRADRNLPEALSAGIASRSALRRSSAAGLGHR